ncbi:cytochrome P450 705A22-like [Mercurialis annua]|uniref:cytochrome P450 705A22-like n=1 Tax=Mercurialis annua TaxID=3986 RepID=UPI0021604844|nr:cytochrome P450 705A22-like [Mercurialis annua]
MILFFFFIWLISAFLLHYLFKKIQTKPPLHLPPSPPSLPFIGHLHLLSPVVTKCFPYLSSKYGPLLYLRLGSRRLLLVSSPSHAAEIFKNNDLAFAERPKSPFCDKLSLFGEFSFLASPYGDYWKFIKKLSATELLGARQVGRFNALRHEELGRFLNRMVQKANKNESVNLGNELMKLTNNIICRMVMSTRCSNEEDEAEKCREMILGCVELVGKIGIATMLGPFKKLGFWFSGRQVNDVTTNFEELLDKILNDHEEKAKKLDGGEGEENDFMDILLQVEQDKDAEFKISKHHIKSFIMDLFLGGTNTSAVTMQWIMAELINHPNAFNNLRHEIDSVVDKNRLITESDLPNLPYLRAVVKETLRLYPPIPAIPRECREDCKIGGFDVPKETIAIIDAYSIMRDPNLWDNPNEFRPERFMKPDDDDDKKNKQNLGFIPFGGGRRMCPASNFALNIIHLSIASMVQCFDFRLLGDEEREGSKVQVNMEAKAGLVMSLATPLLCVPVVHLKGPFGVN